MLETDPRDLLLDNQNDLVIDKDLHWSTGIDGVIQECRIKMQMFKNEWFLDLDSGIPYWGDILGQKPKLAMAAAGQAFTEALLSVEGVTSVPKMDIIYDGTTRRMTVAWSVRCVFGDTPVDTLFVTV